MSRWESLVGKRYGMLTVIEQGGGMYAGRSWICVCDCGEATEANTGHLNRGAVKSCGCLKKQTPPQHRIDKLKTHGMSKTRTYKTWQSMRQRCENENADQYPTYGGAGITVCSEWSSFDVFLFDMGERPKGMTIDRIDPCGNYEPSNCRWASSKEQANNRTNNIEIFSPCGNVFTMDQVLSVSDVAVSGVRHRLSKWFDKDGVKRLPKKEFYETINQHFKFDEICINETKSKKTA